MTFHILEMKQGERSRYLRQLKNANKTYLKVNTKGAFKALREQRYFKVATLTTSQTVELRTFLIHMKCIAPHDLVTTIHNDIVEKKSNKNIKKKILKNIHVPPLKRRKMHKLRIPCVRSNEPHIQSVLLITMR